ncbi:SubName: Full=Uncharacterized protein {ECO:0000313/EMBL:CCA76042.1} [Serendipita indica DSM 11827]|nr:SubName: Full=Uncharacterized protein {ECO:0000313/EMBL:CCA76042.1} [Serendipita indica DSM 11827]
MNQENEGTQTTQRPSSSSGSSLFFLLVMMFMLFSGGPGEAPATQHDIQDSLQSLKYELANYTAWQDGGPSNFTLERESLGLLRLESALLHPPHLPPTVDAAYYNNITGNYKTKTGFIDLELPSSSRGLVDGPSVSLRAEGIHLPEEGSLMALVEPKDVAPDIRHLAGLVPPSLFNDTTHVITEQLKERVKEFEQSISDGTAQLDSDSDPVTRCSFIFRGHLHPMLVHQSMVDLYEQEQKTPTGIPLPKLAAPGFNGLLISEECGIAIELEEVKGISSIRMSRRIVVCKSDTHAAIASAVFYILIQLSLQVSDQWRTTTTLLRGSRGVMATWLIADSYAAISHLMAAVMTSEVRYALLVPGFLGGVLVATDIRLLTYLNGVQLLLSQPAPAPPPPPITTTAPTASTTGVSSTAPTVSQPSPDTTVTGSFLLRAGTVLFANDFRAWLAIVFGFSIFSMLFLGVPIYGVWFILIASTWSGQITRNVYQRTRRVLRHDTIVLSSIVRLFTPLYIFACPNNLLNIEPAEWIWVIPAWVILQTAVLLGQDYFGPSWFIPDFWNRGPVYDYHPDIVKSDEEATESKLGDCSICMEPISADQGDIGPERGKVLQLCWKQAAKKRRVYALAPCGHNFHTDCLEQWMEIKSICPQCRGYLPPL